MFGTLRKLAAASLLTLVAAGGANASSVNGGSLLSNADADQLATWLGVGDQVFTNIWQGNAGVATATSFHSAVDGAGPTFSIFGITLGNGSTAVIGGYTQVDWGGANGYVADPTAFIFNLTTGELQTQQDEPSFAVFRHPDVFSGFGAGGDIRMGPGTLGTCNGDISDTRCDGYSYSQSYDRSQGQITVAGDGGIGAGDSGTDYRHWSVNSLEVYTIAPASVPLPTAFPMLAGGMGLMGILVLRRKKRPSAST